jgi:hypothetical protein
VIVKHWKVKPADGATALVKTAALDTQPEV